MRKFFKNKALYILSATAIIFSCLFIFLFKGPQVEAASIEYDTIDAQIIIANNSTKKYTGKYGTWSWTGVSGINTTSQNSMLGVTGYFEINTANDFKLTYTPNAATKSKIASMYVDIYWAGGDECVPGGVNISNIFSANIERTGYWFFTDGDLTSPNTSKSNVIVTIKKPATGTTVIWECYVRIGYNASAPVTISKGTGVKSVYLATTDNATSGSASGTEYDSGTTVYGYAELAKGYKAKSGWSLVSGTANTEGAKYRVGSVTAGSDNFGTISADATQYSISYNLNSGTHGSSHPSYYYVTTATFTISNPTRTGYTFDGWSGTDITGKTQTLTISKGSIGNRSYTANWTADTYTIAFDKNAEDAIGITNSVTATYDSTRSLPENGYSRVGYDFKGWATSSTGSVVYADEATLTATQVNSLYTTAKKGGTYTLYANWAYVEEIQAVVDDINNIGTLEYTDTCEGKIETAEASYAGLSDIYKEVIAEYAEILENAREVYDNVDATVQAIDAIGTVEYTNTCKANIDGAKALYAALEADELAILPTEKAKALEDADKAYDAMDAINSIGTVVNNETCKAAIITARTVYNNLTTDQKALVAESFTKTLVDDEAVFAVIDLINAIDYENTPECLTRIEDARDAYDDLTADQKAIFPAAELKTIEDTEAAFAVMEDIDAIGTIENTDESRTLVEDARDSYNALDNDEQKALVLNYQTLVDAENSFEAVDNTDKLINDIGTLVYPDSEATISAAKAAYDELTPFEKGLVLNYETLTHKDKAYEVIKEIKQIGSVTYPGSEDAIANAREAYNGLTDLEKDYVGYEYLAILATAEGYYNSLKDNAKASDVIDLIEAIKPLAISDACKEAIEDARAAYDLLTDEQKNLVDNYDYLEKAEEDYTAAKVVVDLIDLIGDVLYPDSADAIEDAREAYDALTEDQKALVYNYELLTEAEEDYKYLEDNEKASTVEGLIDAIGDVEYTDTCKAKIDAAREAYDALTEDQQDLIDEDLLNELIDAEELYDLIDDVVDLIDAIGDVEYTDTCKAKIDAAREAYEALTKDQQALVPEAKLAVLEAAEDTYDELKEQAIIDNAINLINSIGKVKYPDSKDKIDAAREAYDALTADQKNAVGFDNYSTLVSAESYYAALYDSACAEAVKKLIKEIAPLEVNDTCKDKIDAAREAYDALEDSQKILVTNYNVLTVAENDYAAAKAVIELIDLIVIPVTEDNLNKVTAARKAYNALENSQKGLIYNYDELLDAEVGYVVQLIEAIGDVEYTKACKAKIDAARAAYNALTDSQKDMIENYDDLAYSELLYAEIDSFVQLVNDIPAPLVISEETADAIADARDEFDYLTEEAQLIVPLDAMAKLVNNENAYGVMVLINKIGTVEYTDECKTKIDNAKAAYDVITEEQIELVVNKDVLLAAISKYNALKADNDAADAVDALIALIPDQVVYTTECKEAIDNARAAYDALTTDQKALVDNYEDLTDAEAEYATLKADNDAADAVDAVIALIPNPVVYTDACKTAIDDAREAYDDLTPAQKALVDNYATLTAAETAYATLKADNDAADAADALIALIPNPVVYTTECKTAIDNARTAYDALTADQKALVDNYEDLTEAEEDYALLQEEYAEIEDVKELIGLIPNPVVYTDACKDAIDDAREAYDDLTEDQQALVDNYATLTAAEAAYKVYDDNAKADAVDALIALIPNPVVYTDACKDAIDDAREAYDNLTEDQQALVDNYATLTAAEAAYKAYDDNAEADAVDALIALIPNPVVYTDACKTAIDDAREAYDDLTPAQKALVDNYETLTNAETKYDELETDHNAAKAVTDKINAIGTVTYPTSETAITEARNAYDALTKAQQALVTNYATLTNAETEFANKKADYEAAQVVVANINAIGTVTYPASENAIKAAREAYDALTADQKALVDNYATLTNAETKYDELEADHNAAKAVTDKINAIGTVTYPTSETAITEARNVYDALTEAQQALVTNYAILTAAEATFAALKADNDAAQNVVAKINAIGTVTYPTSENAIKAAREAYDALTEAQQALVDNYATLTNAETEFANKKADYEAAQVVVANINAIGTVTYPTSENAIKAARSAYNALTAAQKALVANYATLTNAETEFANKKADYEAAQNVAAKINAIGTVTYPASENAIKAARSAYNALTAAQKALVANYNTLTAAEATFTALKADNDAAKAVVNKINAIGTVKYPTSKNVIQTARTAYDALTAAQKALVTNYNTLIAAEKTYNDVDDVYNQINAIGTVTYSKESKEKIDGAKTAYENLSDDEKELLPNYNKLVASETQYEKLAKDKKTTTAWTIGLIAVAGVIILAGVAYIVLYPNKKKED